MELKLKNTLERAKTYLSIVESIERTERFTREQENWLLKNCRLLQEEMDSLKFRQVEPALNNANGRRLFIMKQPIGTFPNYLKASLPLDDSFIYSALKINLNRFIQIVEDYIEYPKKLKKKAKEKRKKTHRIINFDKIKLIELIFVCLYITSVVLLINSNTFIYGFILNIISVVAILILSFINWEEI